MPSASAGRWRRSRTSAAFAIALAAGCSMACLHSIGNRDVSDDVSANAFSFAGTAIRLERPGSSPQRLAGNRESMSRGESDTQVAMSALAPAAASMSLPLWKRLPVDLMAHITAPIRAYKLAAITKEIVADIKEKFASKKSTSGKSSSAGGAAETLTTLIPQYMKGHVIARTSPEEYRRVLSTSLNLILDAVLADEPYPFEPYHKAIREPLDHYTWGNDFFRSMIKYRGSRLEGLEYLLEIKESLAKGDNVICLANHQTEADPQVLSILCELEGHEDLAEKTIFLAGHKVTTDPLAIPFSKGRNLLTIFSKKYLDKMEAEELEEATVRNRQTVAEWQRLLKEGGHIFWVAPSGGRDRKGESGNFEPAKFDSSSVGLFNILAQKAARGGGPATHFYPLAMWTHGLVPPPDDAKAAVGESRNTERAPVGIEFGAKMVPDDLGGKKAFPGAAEKIVRERYAHLDDLMRR